MRERKNVYKLPTEDNTLLWYSRAVLAMKKRPGKDPRSWNYQAGMHNFDPNSIFWQGAPLPFPSPTERKQFWDKCQHGSWYFLPWHRMYLAYFEEIVAQTVVELGGPANWALPFWDYSDTSNPNALIIPKAFTNPADASNGLWITGRKRNTIRDFDVLLSNAMKDMPFSSSPSTGGVSFGGGERTPINHSDANGQLENTPHGAVHNAINGAMGNPYTAALDPIFWLHHANIDRLWQVWLNLKGNRTNPIKSSWLDTNFEFHDKSGIKVVLKCRDVVDTKTVLSGYTYQDVAPFAPHLAHEAIMEEHDFSRPLEVVAASNKRVALSSEKTIVKLKLSPPKEKKENFSSHAESIASPKRTVLRFENITGKGIPPTQDIYLNVPEEDGNKRSYYAGSISLFGVEASSTPGLHHSGSGQQYTLDVSDLINKLRTLSNWKENQLDITIEPAWEMEESASVKIGRISLYSE